MEQNVKHKLYMGYKGIMLPIPQVLSKKGAQKGEKGARGNANSLTDLERRVHHFIVLKRGTIGDAGSKTTCSIIQHGLSDC
jgi:hypothetical protein